MSPVDHVTDTDVAIVGMAGRFPGANDPDELWRRVAAGEDCLTDLDDDTLIANGVAPAALDDTYVARNGVIDDVEGFDHDFFGIGSRDASIMDPQHRHFLEICWEALEAAAIVPESFDGAIGIFGGCGANTYLLNNLLSDPSLIEKLGWFLLRHTGNDKDFFVNNVAYRLGLTGPAVNVQTACSTSLVAVHLAAQSLLNFECDAALAGGATIEVPHGVGYRYRDGEILSPDGRCRAFDAESQGTVLTSGAGVVLLRRLADALEDGDPILAVVKATAVNNDGARKVGFLAPSVDGHADVVREALALADLSARDIGLIDAHGTGTAVGDPIEVAALTEAFRDSTVETGFCRLTSTKPNIGHLDTAAGVASLIKTVQALRHRTLPSLANHTAPSPLLDLDRTPFHLSADATPWDTDGVRRAGVSSLGVGGTNAHVILEEAPRPAEVAPATPARPQVVVLSAASGRSLAARAERLADAVAADPTIDLGSIVTTHRTGRRTMDHRMVLAVRPDHLLDDLRNTDRGLRMPAIASGQRPRLGFMIAGGGSAYVGMGAGFGPEFGVYHDTLADLRERFLDLDGPDLRSLLDPARADTDLARPSDSLPAVFSVSLAMARQWMALGAEPDFVIGHSLGEYVAAHLAGVMSLDAATALVMGRSRLMEKVSGDHAAMLVVPEPEHLVRARLTSALSLAAVNAPDECTVAGPRDEILDLATRLAADGTPGSLIPIDVAAHSSMLDPILPDFLEQVQRVELRAPERPLVSNVTGTWMTDDQATSATYWVDHLRRTVRFADGLRTAIGEHSTVVAEIGPGHGLSAYARRSETPPLAAVASMRHADSLTDDAVFAHAALGRLWTVDVPVDLDTIAPIDRRQRSAMPVYGFDHQRCWIDRSTDAAISTTGDSAASTDTTVRRIEDLDQMTWVRRWRPAGAAPAITGDRRDQWVVVGDLDDPLVVSTAASLAEHVTVTTVDANNPALPAELDGAVLVASRGGESPSQSRWLGVGTDLARLVGNRGGRYVALTRSATDAGGPAATPADAMALGAALVVSAEYPGATGLVLDLDAEPSVDRAVVADVLGASGVVAHRDGSRFVSVLDPEPLPRTTVDVAGTVQLVTGALGGVGSVLAETLGRSGASLAVVTSSSLPPDAEHDAWLATHAFDDPTSRRLRRLRRLRAAAPRVEVVVADLDTADGAARAIRDATAACGRIDGIVHAAGRLHDELIETLDVDAARDVIMPKADAAIALVNGAAGTPIQRVVLVSSTSTELAPAGQTAYVGANAVLDALAGRRNGVEVTSVGFGLWADRGMASDAGARTRLGLGAGERFEHPVLGEIGRHDQTVELVGRLDAEASWVVDEHRTNEGVAVLPGTGHLDLMLTAARAAGAPTTLADVELEAPVVVGATPVWIRATVETGPEPHVRIESDLGGGTWAVHSSARLVTADPAPALVVSVGEARAVDLFEQQAASLSVGSRWQADTSLASGPDAAVASIAGRVPPGETGAWMLHPALADLATAVGVTLRLDDGLHVPTGYASVESLRSLTPDFTTVAGRRPESTAEELVVDLDLLVEDEPACRIRGLRLRLLEAGALTPAVPAVRSPRSVASLVTSADDIGLQPAEGTTLLSRLVASDHRYGVISSVDLDALRVLADVDEPGADRSAPGATLEDRLATIFSDLLGVDDVAPDADFFDLGGHSLLAIRLTGRIHAALGVRIQIAALADAATVDRLAALLRERQPGIDEAGSAGDGSSPQPRASTAPDSMPDAAAWRSLVPISREGEGRPLYVVHGAGGNVLFLWSLARGLAGDRPVYGFQAKGSEGGLMPDASIETMAERYVDELMAHDDGPYLLGGFSGGGVVALEMTRILEARGATADLVVLFDTPTPGNLRPSFARRWINVARTAVTEGPSAVSSHLRSVVRYWTRRALPRADARQAQLDQNARELGYIVEDGQVADLYFHFTSTADKYVPTRYRTAVALIRADEVRPTQAPDYGWIRFIDGPVQVSTTPGDHHTMFYPENVGVLADLVRDAIASVGD
ncbi:MAG: beta-ketoacyl synthase N-terminal-like domain-containing protein [Actinomycetota bacterium]